MIGSATGWSSTPNGAAPHPGTRPYPQRSPRSSSRPPSSAPTFRSGQKPQIAWERLFFLLLFAVGHTRSTSLHLHRVRIKIPRLAIDRLRRGEIQFLLELGRHRIDLQLARAFGETKIAREFGIGE